jgi:hypothetical protein
MLQIHIGLGLDLYGRSRTGSGKQDLDSELHNFLLCVNNHYEHTKIHTPFTKGNEFKEVYSKKLLQNLLKN